MKVFAIHQRYDGPELARNKNPGFETEDCELSGERRDTRAGSRGQERRGKCNNELISGMAGDPGHGPA